jgi:hypothetical protein
MTRLMSENEKKRTRAEQKIEEETNVLKMKENDVITLTAKLDEENRRKDFLIQKVNIISWNYWGNMSNFWQQ